MKTVEELLEELMKLGCRLRVECGELSVKAPKGALTGALREEVGRRKGELIRALGGDAPEGAARRVDFSLFFFADDASASEGEKYRLLLEASRFADRHGFRGVWTPERHFHPLGGLYPNPSVVSAALAMTTENLRLRAGNVNTPLHDPLRIAEEWAVVDNLSGGRVEVGFGCGWHVDDFALAPGTFERRREIMFETMETVRRLWRGETLRRVGGAGKEIEVQTRPRPLQSELPVWISAVGNPDTYREAGERGAQLLTCLLTQEVDELIEKLEAYRAGLERGGHPPSASRIVVFLHSYLGRDVEAVREEVRGPFTAYLERSLDLVANLAAGAGSTLNPAEMEAEDRRTLLDFAFERYFERRTLLGTPESCRPMVERLGAAGVDEIACLIDFGLPEERVLEGLEPLAELVREYAA